MKKTKVALITQDFYPMKGGIASYLLQIYFRYFRKSNFEVILPKSFSKEDFSNFPFEVKFTEFTPFNFADKKREDCNKNILKILCSFQPDLVLFGYLRSHPETGLMYKKINPLSKFGIFTYGKEVFLKDAVVKRNQKFGSHKGYLKKEVNFYENILNKADGIFSVSEFTKKVLQKQGIKRKIEIIYPSVPRVKKYNYDSARKKLKFKKDNIILLSVGRLIKRKGQDKVIRVMPELLRKYPGIKYVIVGSGSEKNNLIKLVNRLNLSKEVIFAENITEEKLPLYYSASDIFVLPCDFIKPNDVEGLGIVFLEANSYGLPTIGGNSGGVPEAIINGKTGFLVNSKSDIDLIKKISYLVENPDILKRMETHCRRLFIKSNNSTTLIYLNQ